MMLDLGSAQSLVFYLIVFFISTSFVYAGSSRRYSRQLAALFTGIGIVIPAVVSGTRYAVGLDYPVYLEIYNGIGARSLYDVIVNSSGVEVLFEIVASLSSGLFHSPIPLFLVYGLLTIGFFYAGILKLRVRYPWLLYLLFLLIIFPLSFNIMKQALAISLVFFAFSLILNKQTVKGSIAIAMAVVSHTSALIAVPLAFIPGLWAWLKNKLSSPGGVVVKTSLLLVSFGLMFYVAIPIMLSGGNDKYSDLYGAGGYYSDSEASPLRLMLKVLVIAVIVMVYAKLRKVTKHLSLIFLFVIIEFMLLVMGISSAPISRISLYLLPYSIVILAEIPQIIRVGWRRRIITAGIIMFGVVYFIALFYVGGGSGIFPYRSWLG